MPAKGQTPLTNGNSQYKFQQDLTIYANENHHPQDPQLQTLIHFREENDNINPTTISCKSLPTPYICIVIIMIM